MENVIEKNRETNKQSSGRLGIIRGPDFPMHLKGDFTDEELGRRRPSEVLPTGLFCCGDRELLYWELSQLRRLVDEAYGDGHLIRCWFEKTMRSDIDDYFAPMAELLELKKKFYSQPDSEVRRVLNGWKPIPDRPLPSEVLTRMEDAVTRVLDVRFSPSTGKVSTYHEFTFESNLNPVAVSIREGATRKEVIAALDAIRNHLAEHFESAIGGEDVDQ